MFKKKLKYMLVGTENEIIPQVNPKEVDPRSNLSFSRSP